MTAVTKSVNQGAREVYGDICFGDTANLDAFGRLRTSEPTGLFDSQFQYDLMPLLWEQSVSGGGTITHAPDKSGALLETGTVSGDEAVLQTRAYHRYQPGKSQLIMITFVLVDRQANLRQRAGYFDADNGIFFEHDGDTAAVVLRSKISGTSSDTRVAQSDWNLDAMDGSGRTQITLDVSQSQLFFIDLEWLSVGRVRVGFVIDGLIVYVHEFLNANVAADPYMTTANLPLRYEMTNTATTAAAADFLAICATVVSEGGFEEERGFPFCTSNGTTEIGVTTRRPVLSIRPKATFNSIVNRGLINVRRIDGVARTNTAYVEIVYNGSLTGASFASVDANSIVEGDVGATAISGGSTTDAFFVPAGSGNASSTSGMSLLSKLPITLDIDGANPIVLSVVATSFAATSNLSASVFWTEIR